MIELSNMVLNWALFVACGAVFGCYLRRVFLLNFAAHKTGSVVFHLFLGALSFCVGFRAYYGEVGLYELLAFGASATWIVVSFNDWRDGVPARAIRPKPFGVLVALNDLNDLLHNKTK